MLSITIAVQRGCASASVDAEVIRHQGRMNEMCDSQVRSFHRIARSMRWLATVTWALLDGWFYYHPAILTSAIIRVASAHSREIEPSINRHPSDVASPLPVCEKTKDAIREEEKAFYKALSKRSGLAQRRGNTKPSVLTSPGYYPFWLAEWLVHVELAISPDRHLASSELPHVLAPSTP